MNKVILRAEDIDGYLNAADKKVLAWMDEAYREVTACFTAMSGCGNEPGLEKVKQREEKKLIRLFNSMGAMMQEVCKNETGIQVYSFVTPRDSHAEASRLIAKLRDNKTENGEFVYYTQRAYEMLFKLAYGGMHGTNKNYMIVKTPVTVPVQNFAVHKIINIDNRIGNTVMCVMLRGALLPSMIMSKEIQEYSSNGYVTPFALFKIHRNEAGSEKDMEYILDLDKSYFNPEQLDGKDLVFADPMNATGGSLVTVVKYLLGKGVKPKSIQIFNAISALKGAIRSVRALENCKVYTLWMDPVLNNNAYILPGLGDAGDRINGYDSKQNPRDIIQLVADYGSNIAKLYRAQLGEIENMVLNKRKTPAYKSKGRAGKK
ncbi:MAG: uracil phosphoribosyltransferase [Treponema sp.]|jgi:uracil phosphoribosyltransferase|nr:uracil phosphoribosyltransferase [Treponema sp.]